MIAYTVCCSIEQSDVADRWLAWLHDRHLEDVCDAGALDAEVIELEPGADGSTRRFEVRYHFASRDEFVAYERDHAPRLREEGLTLFPLELGLSYARTVGEMRDCWPRSS